MKDFQQSSVQRFIDLIDLNFAEQMESFVPTSFTISTCSACNESALWVNKQLRFPNTVSVPIPNQDLDSDIKDLYIEASSILSASPKGAAALLRLALHKLLKQIGQDGDNINKDIGSLVKLGLDPKLQQALDVLRVVGNNAVHPGTIDFNDDSKVAEKLFPLLNFIADELISKPKNIQELYADLVPEPTKEAIKKRDFN